MRKVEMLRVCDVFGRNACVQGGVYYKDNYSVAVIDLKSAVPNQWGVYYTFLKNDGHHCGLFVDNIPFRGYYRPAALVDNNIPFGGYYLLAALVDLTLGRG